MKDELPEKAQGRTEEGLSGKNGLLCEDCGSEFSRTKEYLSQKRTDPLFKWTCAKCDTCKKKRQDAAFKRMPEIMAALIT